MGRARGMSVEERPRTTRLVVAGTGVAVVVLYAGLLVLESLVLDPLAAVPGSSLAQIHAHLQREGFSVGTDIATVIGIAAVGVVLAIGVAWSLLVTRARTHVVAAVMLAVVVFGAPASFGSGFALGMDVADAYGTDGADHTIWAGVMYGTSAVALALIPLVLVIGHTLTVRRTARRTQAV